MIPSPQHGHSPAPIPRGALVQIKVHINSGHGSAMEGPYRLLRYIRHHNAAVIQDAAGHQWTEPVGKLAFLHD
jgi:hypothetical protein